MKLIGCEWNAHLNKFEVTYLADTEADIAMDKVDPNCAEGSTILVIATKSMYIKNNAGKWQKFGTDEVI